MRRVQLVSACLIVAAACGAVSVASAAAEPTWYECAQAKTEAVKYEKKGKSYEKTVPTGAYKNEATCRKGQKYTKDKYRKLGQHPGPEGAWELQELAGEAIAFSGTDSGVSFDAAGIGGITCTAGSGSGRLSGPASAADVVEKFTGCEYNGRKCTSAGAAEGELVNYPLAGDFGYLEGKGTGSPKVGIDLSQESGELISKMACREVDFAATGSIIGEITPVNTFTNAITFTFNEKSIGVQEWEALEGGPKDTLSASVCVLCSEPSKEGSTIGGAQRMTIVVHVSGRQIMLKA